MIRKSDSTSVRIPSDSSGVAPAASTSAAGSAGATSSASSRRLFPDVFETPRAGAVSTAARVSTKPSAEENLAELQMLRALTSGDAQGAQEARDALHQFRSQRLSGNKP